MNHGPSTRTREVDQVKAKGAAEMHADHFRNQLSQGFARSDRGFASATPRRWKRSFIGGAEPKGSGR
jgi:hypothetical protein